MKMVNRFKNYLSMRMHGYDMRKAETEQKQCLSAAITPVDFRPTNDGFYIQIDGETYVQCLVVGNPSPVNSGRQGIPPKSSTSIVDDILSIAAQSETCIEVAQIFPLPPDDENKELEGARRSNAVASVMQEEEDKGIVKMHNRINDFVAEGIDDYHRKVYDGESRLYKFAFIIAVQGVSIRDVDKTMNIIKSKLDSKRILHETPRYGMVDVFKSMMPTPFVVERILDTILGDTAAKMCPLRNPNPRLANSGRFIGMNDKTKNPIFIKFDGGNEDVVSGHSLVIGKSGSGKSTELLKDDIRAVADGDDALHIVPKDDDTTNHVRVCKAMDGQLIKIGHGGTNFNMLQVFFDPSRMEDSKDFYQKAYSEHVFTMTTCLGLLVGDGFSDAQKNWLYSSLATLYERFSVVDSKGDVINTDQWQDGMFWPNLEDLRGIWDEWLQDGDHKAGSMPIGALYNNTAMLTEKGPLGFLVNHNSLKLNNPFIVVDISALSTVPNVQDARTLLIMNIVNTKLACAKKGEKKKRIFITLDEGANLVKNSRMKNGIEKLYREGRSRGACIKLVSQDLSGYDRSTIGMLKANSDYILLLSNMRSDNVKPLISEFNLNDDDINRLLEKGKGIGLFIIGSTHLYYRNTLRSRHRTNYAQISSGCLDFQDHNHQLKSNFMKNLPNIFCDSYLVILRKK